MQLLLVSTPGVSEPQQSFGWVGREFRDLSSKLEPNSLPMLSCLD